MKTLPHGSPRRVVIYCRISDDREGKRWGVARQEKVCRERADRNGWIVVAVLVENDISAYSGKTRPKYQQLLDMLRSGEADAVLALSGKRLQRNWRDAFAFLDLAEERDIAIDTIKAGAFNLNTAEGRGQARRAAIDAQEESEEIGERVRDAKQDNLREGTYRGGPRPFGYEADGVTPRSLVCPACYATEGFTVDRECERCGEPAINAQGSEAWHTEQATDGIIAGGSLRAAARVLAAQGVRTVPRRYKQPDGTRGEPEDREWSGEELRKLLLRPRNAGLMEKRTKGPDGKLHSEVVGRAGWAPIVPEEKWRACKAILEQPGRRTTTSNGRVWLGSGIYRCGVLAVRYQTSDGRQFVHNGEFEPVDNWALYVADGGDAERVWTAEQLFREAGPVITLEKGPLPAGKRGCPETVRCSTSGKGPGREHVAAYRCRTGKHITRTATLLDEYVERVALDRLKDPDALQLRLVPSQGTEKRADLAATANALRGKLDAYTQDYVDDLITRQQMLDGTALTRKRLEHIEAEMSALARGSVLASLPADPDAIEQEWPGYDLSKKRAILDALMIVTLMPARRGRPAGYVPGSGTYFDASTIKIEWKTPE